MGHGHGGASPDNNDFDTADVSHGRLHMPSLRGSHSEHPLAVHAAPMRAYGPAGSSSSTTIQTLPAAHYANLDAHAAPPQFSSMQGDHVMNNAAPPRAAGLSAARPPITEAVSEQMPMKPIILAAPVPSRSPAEDSPPGDKPAVQQDPTKVSTPERQLPRMGPPKERKTARDIHKCNSTSTMFVDTTMEHPNNALTTLCVAKAVHRLMQADAAKRPVVHPMFELTPSQRAYLTSKNLGFPSVAIIHTFLANFFRDAQLAPECNVVGFCYLIRFMRMTGVTMSPTNWRQLLYACFCLASKMYDDLSMINRDFAVVCPVFNLQETNEMELALLDVFRFDLVVSGAEYAAFYFRLQQEREQQQTPTLLRKVTAQQLEVACPTTQAPPKPLTRNRSFDGLKVRLPEASAILS